MAKAVQARVAGSAHATAADGHHPGSLQICCNRGDQIQMCPSRVNRWSERSYRPSTGRKDRAVDFILRAADAWPDECMPFTAWIGADGFDRRT